MDLDDHVQQFRLLILDRDGRFIARLTRCSPRPASRRSRLRGGRRRRMRTPSGGCARYGPTRRTGGRATHPRIPPRGRTDAAPTTVPTLPHTPLGRAHRHRRYRYAAVVRGDTRVLTPPTLRATRRPATPLRHPNPDPQGCTPFTLTRWAGRWALPRGTRALVARRLVERRHPWRGYRPGRARRGSPGGRRW
jgi:hypothetical protein